MNRLLIVLFMMCCFAASSAHRMKPKYKTPLAKDEVHEDASQCLTEGSDGSEYRGTVSVSNTRHTCLKWNEAERLLKLKSATKEPGNHNYCRNPDKSIMPWCWVKRRSRIVRELCNVEECNTKLEPKQDTETTCGERNVSAMFKIVGGYKSSIESQPWIASIFKRTMFICGGTLIAPCWVLTAAHCFPDNDGTDTEKYSVSLGKNNVNVNEFNKEQSFKVAKVVIHEDYDFTKQNFNNDIALIQIKGRNGQCAQSTSSVRTVCLPPPQQMMPFGVNCLIAGYGSEKSIQVSYSYHLKEASVRLISQRVCKRADYYGEHEIPLTHNMFCAASPTWKDDACQGDSGGPLVCEANGRMFLFGIISWGDQCAFEKKPGVYTKVTNYNNWIAKHTGLNTYTTGIMYPRKD